MFAVRDCGPVPTVPGSTTQTTGTKVGDTVTYMCVAGYVKTAGSNTITCLDTGTWNINDLPTCTSKFYQHSVN